MTRKHLKFHRLYRIQINETFYFTHTYSRKQAYLQIATRLKNKRRKYNVWNRVV